MPSPPPSPRRGIGALLERCLRAVTWVTALAAMAVLLLGLRDVPRRALPLLPATVPVQDGVSLCARVLDAERALLKEARVSVYSQRSDRRFVQSADGRTDAAGRICFSLLPAGTTWVLAEAPAHARGSTELVLTEQREVELVLPRAARFAVHVSDELGAAVPKATVLVTGSDPLPYGKLSDASGNAQFDYLVPAPWRVQVHCVGYESAERFGVNENLNVVLRRLGSIDVQVVSEDGAPAAAASVLIAGSALWPARRAETDANGVAKIRGLSAGSYDLQATRGDDVSAAMLGFELARGAQESLTLRLAPGRRVSARVVDGENEDAAPVAEADVVLVEAGLSSFPLRGRTARDGSVRLGPIHPGPATLLARHPDFVAGQLTPVPDPLTGVVRVVLERGATLRGEVVDARGAPIGGASIEVVGTDRFGLPIAETPQTAQFRATHFAWSLQGPPALVPAGELGVMPGPVPPIPPSGVLSSSADGAPDGLAHPGAASRALTDAFDTIDRAPWVTRDSGEFEAKPVPAGRVRALVRHPEYVEAASEIVSVAPGGEARVRVVLLRGGELEGRVLDERGFPVAGVDVQVSAERGTFQRSTITASDGAFAFAAVPEAVSVSVSRPAEVTRVALRKSVHVPEGGRAELELTLPAPREDVALTVVDDRDQPIELAEIRVASLELGAPLRSTLFSDAGGHATLPDARGLPLSVTIEAPRFTRLSQTVAEAPAELHFKLDLGVIVSGQITAVRGRRTVAGAAVTLRAGAERKSTLSDRDGNYRFNSVPPGHVELLVTHPDYADGTLGAEIAPTARGDRPFELPAIDLADPGEVEGQVLDHDGNPQAGARVSVGTPAAYLPAGALPHGVALTDAHGRFTLRGVSPGTVRLGAIAADGAQGSSEAVEVSAGRSVRDLTIRLGEVATHEDSLALASLALSLGERGEKGSALEVVIVQVPAGSEAERAGVLPGDVLRAVDGENVSSMRDARARLGGREGSDVILDLTRGGTPLRLRVAREAVRR